MKNNENHIFIDTNCLISSLCERYGINAANGKENTNALHYLLAMNGKKLYVSSLTIAQMTAKLQNYNDKQHKGFCYTIECDSIQTQASSNDEF